MKHRIYVAALLLLHTCAQAENVYGKSYFSDFQDYSLFGLHGHTLAVDQHHNEGHVLNKPQISSTVFGGRSRDVDGLRKYFLFGGKDVLHVKEYTNIAPGTAIDQRAQDILFADFNVQTRNTAQESDITLAPEQSRIGFAISMRYPFKEKLWFTVDAPFVHVKNAINLVETYTYSPHTSIGGVTGFNDENPTVTTMFEAFRQKGMNYGRIDGTQKKTGLADMTIRLGYNSVNREDLFISQFAGVIIPTGNRPNAKHMWEAVVGNGHHFGVVGGNTMHFCVHESTRGKIWLTNSVEGKFLVQNTQKRSLDLKNGPWTRYLAMYANDTTRSTNEQTFGINLMTRDVEVSPGASTSFATQLSFMGDKYNWNVGVVSRYRQAERIKLANEWTEGPQVANIADTDATGSVIPSRRMGECNNNDSAIAGGGDPVNYYIKESDIDFSSAAHPNVIGYALHGALGYYHHTNHPQHYEVGGSYEFSQQNTMMNRWTVWAKLQITF